MRTFQCSYSFEREKALFIYGAEEYRVDIPVSANLYRNPYEAKPYLIQSTFIKLKQTSGIFAFTTQPNTLKGWGAGALVSQAQDMFY